MVEQKQTKVYCDKCKKLIEERATQRTPFYVVNGGFYSENEITYSVCGDCLSENVTPTLKELNEYDELLEQH